MIRYLLMMLSVVAVVAPAQAWENDYDNRDAYRQRGRHDYYDPRERHRPTVVIPGTGIGIDLGRPHDDYGYRNRRGPPDRWQQDRW